jgi:glycyl-tRNA synthetase (class II)
VATPFCVTVRFRDSMEQIRVKREELEPTLKQAIKDYKRV